MSFAGKSVLVTGAASGFGRLAAERFAAEGAKLTLADLDPGVEAVAERLGARAMVCDVSLEADVDALTDLALETGAGRLDVALNNAGIVHKLSFFTEIPYETFQKQMAVNVGGVFLGMRRQLAAMKAQGGGAIVNTASVAGLLSAPRLAAYAAAKHAVVGLTRTAADEYARYNVRVNAICPSFTETPMADEMRGYLGAGREEDHRFLGRIPMGRVAAPEEIVQAMLWAASDGNSFMTGQTIALDGGLTAT